MSIAHVSLFIFLFVIVSAYDLPYYEAPRGTHYETGLAVGKHFSSRISEFLQGYATLSGRLRPFFKSNEGQQVVRNFIQDNTNRYPHYADELIGIAHGANVSVEDIWLMNLRNEINAIINRNETFAKPEDLNCMDILLNDGNVMSIAHNEDSESRIKNYAYLLKLNIIGQPSFVAYTYPGMIPGNAFGFNQYGTIITTNSNLPIDSKARGVARSFLNRDFYNVKSSTDIIELIKQVKDQIATGFTVNFGNTNESLLYNVEVAPNLISTRVINPTDPRMAHFNLYQRISVPEHKDPSSVHRKNRYDEFLPVKSKVDMLNILGDTKDTEYPIYRNAKYPDYGVVTTASVYFDFLKRKATVYICNPRQNEPLYELGLK